MGEFQGSQKQFGKQGAEGEMHLAVLSGIMPSVEEKLACEKAFGTEFFKRFVASDTGRTFGSFFANFHIFSNRFCADFARRFMSLLGGPFRELTSSLALSIVFSALKDGALERKLLGKELELYMTPHDIKRLEAYGRNLVDFHLVTDLLPIVAKLFFQGRLGKDLTLSFLQRALLLGMGLQSKRVDTLGEEYDMPGSQLLALFNKSMRKIHKALAEILTEEAEAKMESTAGMKSARKLQGKLRNRDLLTPLNKSMDAEQLEEGRKASAALNKEIISQLDLSEFAVKGGETDWESAEKAGLSSSGIVSIKSHQKPKKNKRDAEFQRSPRTKHKRKKNKA